MTINQLAHLAKLLEDSTKPESKVRETKTPTGSKGVYGTKGVHGTKQVLKVEKKVLASPKPDAEKSTAKYLKRVANPAAGDSLSIKTIVDAPENKEKKEHLKSIVPSVGASLLGSLKKGSDKGVKEKDTDESREAWKAKGKQRYF